MRLYRVLVTLFGALPATALGSFALGMAFGGLRMLTGAEFSGGLFAIWGLLGLAGVAGLWLAVLEGPHSRGAAGLIVCGLIAEAVLIGLMVFGDLQRAAHVVAAPSGSLRTIEIVSCLVGFSPFMVGAMYIAQCFVSRRRALVQ